jgi:hypothetical protein
MTTADAKPSASSCLRPRSGRDDCQSSEPAPELDGDRTDAARFVDDQNRPAVEVGER